MIIFVLDRNPITSARMMCDKHIPKMCVESLQMMGSALRRHGATDDQMPLSEAGKPIKGGYHHHPCTVWAGDSRANFAWLGMHGLGLCIEYELRFGGKVHKCEHKIQQMYKMAELIPNGALTPFAQAMPDQYKCLDAVRAYRNYYRCEKAYFAKWQKGRAAPYWWPQVDRDGDPVFIHKVRAGEEIVA